jgi:signal transduction histidine kinase
MLWHRSANGFVHAAELDRVRLLSELVAALPDTDPAEGDLGGRLRLVDSTGRTLYQWGEYEPPEGSRPFETLNLGHPLAAWALEFHASDGALGTAVVGGLVLNLVAGMALLAAVVFGSGAYFYREHTREMREAAQRVSFVNQVSHELKTPLTNIRLYAEMLEDEVSPKDDDARRHAEIVVSESQRLSRLIGNILTFSRQQRKVLELNRRPGVVDEVLGTCLDRFRPALDAKGIAVEFEAGAPHRTSFDHDIVEQIVGNLIGNVEKYAAEGKRLRVTSEQHGNKVTVLVADDGRGIPMRERERIFQPFYRLDNKLTEGVGGTGIGLSIARELARLHGGDLELIPAPEGACFRLTIDGPAIGRGDA